MKLLISIVALVILCGSLAFATVTKTVGPVEGAFQAHVYCVPGSNCGGSAVVNLGSWFPGEIDLVAAFPDVELRSQTFFVGLVNKNVTVSYSIAIQKDFGPANWLKYEIGKQWDLLTPFNYFTGELTALGFAATTTSDVMRFATDVADDPNDTECIHTAYMRVLATRMKSESAGACQWTVTFNASVSI